MKVGITGAAGLIGQRLAAGLRGKYELTLFDLKEEARGDGVSIMSADVSDREALAGRFEGLDAIIHLAAIHRSNPSFADVVRSNIVGTYNLIEEARRAKVRRIVFASTNHTQNARAASPLMDMSATSQAFVDTGKTIKPTDPPAPDSYYGVSKLCCEDLGRYYAEFLRCIEFVALRIGWSAPGNPNDAPLTKIMRSPDVERHYRALFLSERDTVHLFDRALQAKLTFLVCHATSANPQPVFDLTDTIDKLGFSPQDNSDKYFDDAQSNPVGAS
jgi:nucleoside-diphosphate-sugar epimerase